MTLGLRLKSNMIPPPSLLFGAKRGCNVMKNLIPKTWSILTECLMNAGYTAQSKQGIVLVQTTWHQKAGLQKFIPYTQC